MINPRKNLECELLMEKGSNKGLWKRVTGAIVGGFMLAGLSNSPAVVPDARAATEVQASVNYEQKWTKVGPPGLFEKGISSRLVDAYVSRSDLKVAKDILLHEMDGSDIQKHPAWWYVLAHVEGKINSRIPTIFNVDKKKSKEAAFAIGIDQYVALYELPDKKGTCEEIKISFTIALLGLVGIDINNPLQQANNFSKLQFNEKNNILQNINPSNLSRQDSLFATWTINAYLLNCEKSGNTNFDEYKILKDIQRKYNFPTVLL